jgi:hypothetical protein
LTYNGLVDDLLDERGLRCSVRHPASSRLSVTVLFADDAGVIAHKAWFENLRDTFLNAEAYAEDDTETTSPAAEPKSPAAGHGAPTVAQFGGTFIPTIVV